MFTVPLDLVDRPPGVEVASVGVETVVVRVEGRGTLPAPSPRGGLPGGGEPQERPAGPLRRPHRRGQRVRSLGSPGRAGHAQRGARDPGDAAVAMGRLFGTDGVRGVANEGPLTPEDTCRLGRAAAAYLAERVGPGRRRPALLIARDTRLSGPAPRAGAGRGHPLGGRGRARRGRPADAGHRLPHSRARARRAARCCRRPTTRSRTTGSSSSRARATSCRTPGRTTSRRGSSAGPDGPRPTGAGIGRVRSVRGAERRYLDGLRASLPAGFDLTGVKLVLDCAHGATYRVAPRLFRSLGADVTTLGTRPSGTNINRGRGGAASGSAPGACPRDARGHRSRVRRRRRPPHRRRRVGRRPRRGPRPRDLRSGARRRAAPSRAGSWSRR